MIRANVHHAKTHLSRLLERVEAGEVVTLCRRNVPVAEIRRIEAPRETPRPVGLGRDRFVAEATFDEPLREETERSFEVWRE